MSLKETNYNKKNKEVVRLLLFERNNNNLYIYTDLIIRV
jgi:hypothetical protein